MAKTKEEEERDKALPIVGILGLGAAGALAWWLLRKPKPEPDKAILFGLVTDAETHEGISNINVDCDGCKGKTDANGQYSIINIPPGSYMVTFTDPSGRYEAATI